MCVCVCLCTCVYNINGKCATEYATEYETEYETENGWQADDEWDEGKVGLLVDCMETGLHAFGSLGRASFLKRPKAAKVRAGKEDATADMEDEAEQGVEAEETNVAMKADEEAKKSKKKKKVEKVKKGEEASEKKKTTKKKKRKNAEVS